MIVPRCLLLHSSSQCVCACVCVCVRECVCWRAIARLPAPWRLVHAPIGHGAAACRHPALGNDWRHNAKARPVAGLRHPLCGPSARGGKKGGGRGSPANDTADGAAEPRGKLFSQSGVERLADHIDSYATLLRAARAGAAASSWPFPNYAASLRLPCRHAHVAKAFQPWAGYPGDRQLTTCFTAALPELPLLLGSSAMAVDEFRPAATVIHRKWFRCALWIAGRTTFTPSQAYAMLGRSGHLGAATSWCAIAASATFVFVRPCAQRWRISSCQA